MFSLSKLNNQYKMLNKICPCLAWFGSPQTKQLPRKGYKPYQQFEQEQFMHQLQSEAKKSKSIPNKIMSEEIPIQQQLQHALNLNQEPQKVSTPQTEIKQNDKKENDSHKQQTQQSTSRSENEETSKSQEVEKSYGFTNLGQLQVNIPEYGANYQLLKEKAHNAAELLDVNQNCSEVSLNPGLSVKQSKLNLNKPRLRAWRTSTPNCFIIEYEIPSSYAYYNEMVNKKIQPKDNCKQIRQFKLIETLHPNLSLRYICMNKIGMLEPRDFTYLKYTNMSTTNPSGHWQLCVSKDGQKQSNSPSNSSKPGKLFSVSYIIEQHKPESNVGIRVKVRTYVNLQINVTIQKVWEQILTQTKNYINDIWDEAANNYSEELV